MNTEHNSITEGTLKAFKTIMDKLPVNKKQTPYQQVHEFMTTFGQEVPAKPCIPSLDIRKLRAKLILEEALETIDALGFNIVKNSSRGKRWNEWIPETVKDLSVEESSKEPNLTSLIDGLCDLDYVSRCGTAIACGITEEVLNKAQNEVHRSNMSKLWTQKEIDALAPCLYSYEKISNNEHCYLVKNPDGKVIKSPSYSPANLEQFLI